MNRIDYVSNKKVIENESLHTNRSYPFEELLDPLCPILGNHFHADFVNVNETSLYLSDIFHKTLLSRRTVKVKN